MMARSIRSVRARDREGAIYAVCFGQPGPELERARTELGVTIEIQAPLEPRWRLWLKWKAMAALGSRLPAQLLVLDNDTFVLGDLEPLFAKYAEVDVAARADVGCERGSVAGAIGDTAYEPAISWPIMDAVCRAVGARPLDVVINGGIVLFNRNAAQKFAATVDAMSELGELWQAKDLPYPSTNGWIQDGVAATVGIGLIEGAEFSPLTEAEAPYFIEVRASGPRPSHLIVHTWGPFYREALRMYYGESELAEFDAATLAVRAPDPAPRVSPW
jgi:hypothetical protein